MGFNAVEVIEPLDWDFTGFKPGGEQRWPRWPRELYNAKGTITEPSDEMIGDFMDGMKKLTTEAQKEFEGLAELGDNPTPEEMVEALASLSGKDVVAFHGKMATLHAGLCSGSPSEKQILLLPMRARALFYGWLMSEVVSPEAGTGAGNGQLIQLPTAAAGSRST